MSVCPRQVVTVRGRLDRKRRRDLAKRVSAIAAGNEQGRRQSYEPPLPMGHRTGYLRGVTMTHATNGSLAYLARLAPVVLSNTCGMHHGGMDNAKPADNVQIWTPTVGASCACWPTCGVPCPSPPGPATYTLL